MRVRLNGEPVEVPEKTTLGRLLADAGRDPTREPIAVALNLGVVPRAEVERRELRDGDRVDVVSAVGGG